VGARALPQRDQPLGNLIGDTVLGIVVALSSERRWITQPGADVIVEQSGVGGSRAEKASQRLADRGAVGLVSWGVAGGLQAGLDPGTVVLPGAVLLTDGRKFESDRAWRERLVSCAGNQVVISTGSLLHTDNIIGDPGAKLELHDRTGAVAADMESGAVAAVAVEAGLPWIAVRVIVDAAHQRVPSAALEAVDDHGDLRPGVFLTTVLNPAQWPAMVRLWRAWAAAGRSMRRVWCFGKPALALDQRLE
jgi:adenosylhomocysteine nucleosidase